MKLFKLNKRYSFISNKNYFFKIKEYSKKNYFDVKEIDFKKIYSEFIWRFNFWCNFIVLKEFDKSSIKFIFNLDDNKKQNRKIKVNQKEYQWEFLIERIIEQQRFKVFVFPIDDIKSQNPCSAIDFDFGACVRPFVTVLSTNILY